MSEARCDRLCIVREGDGTHASAPVRCHLAAGHRGFCEVGDERLVAGTLIHHDASNYPPGQYES